VVVDGDRSCCICVMFRLALPLVIMPDTTSGRNDLASRPVGFCYWRRTLIVSTDEAVEVPAADAAWTSQHYPWSGRFPPDIQLGSMI